MQLFGLFTNDLDRALAVDEAHYAVRDHGADAKAHLKATLSTRTWRDRTILSMALSYVRNARDQRGV